ncbi:MAG: hypothetical protein KGL02_07220 [Acidobacteriota bacterium]|nr:hypothetical protein [Acidobacteriota bacterium]MDE3170472.1 hypothetical protein [Acidobacteriota bacterium]
MFADRGVFRRVSDHSNNLYPNLATTVSDLTFTPKPRLVKVLRVRLRHR